MVATGGRVILLKPLTLAQPLSALRRNHTTFFQVKKQKFGRYENLVARHDRRVAATTEF